ncbi:TRAP transporter small permease subunit [Piscinibacter sp.]|uniref:TRAP transporter small permease subunit n=1 Tax=Piscinibacter sp. TaxID=1903157 RepID=UPI002CE38457|nr:TRAP transporter small permease subunit [Albitalea sp.]HUG25240.1 TRAP transporter small permease subunit [Albitalea sp.]
MIQKFIYGIDQLSKTVGHVFAWLIIVLMLGTCYEVFVRYVLNNPTSWAFDMSYIVYGGLFLMAGAYTLSRNGHVRGDVLYRLWPPRVQASVELSLYVLFYFPGVISLMVSGWAYGYDAFKLQEVSINSPVGVPVWQLKILIPFAGFFLALQGIAEVLRCVLCLREGHWAQRLHDVEELEDAIAAEHAAKAKQEAP